MAKEAKLTYLSFNEECSIWKHIDFIIVVTLLPFFIEFCYSKRVVILVTIASRRIDFYFWDFRVVVISHILGRKKEGLRFIIIGRSLIATESILIEFSTMNWAFYWQKVTTFSFFFLIADSNIPLYTSPQL